MKDTSNLISWFNCPGGRARSNICVRAFGMHQVHRFCFFPLFFYEQETEVTLYTLAGLSQSVLV
jgi:hypothetical protein